MHLRLIKNDRPKPTPPYSGPHHQAVLRACDDPRLDNPFLNSIYKNNITRVERWYLEARKLLLEENWEHPILEIMICDHDLRRRLLESVIIDGAAMRWVLAQEHLPAYHVSAGVNLNRLNRWAGFFVSLDYSSR